MSATQFKLTKPGGLTRRVQFPNIPSWSVLSSKIASLYDIPVEKVAVSYIDGDGDEVTLSSEDELQDLYAANYKPSQTIKFSVHDLRSNRDSHQSPLSAVGSATPRNAHYRNTFGQDGIMGFPEEDDWQNVPAGGIFGVASSDSFSGPQAYIEQLSSDASSVHKPDGDLTMDSDLSSVTTNKGKGKALSVTEDDISSTGSILVSEANIKYPIHVLDVADEGMIEPAETEVSKPGIKTPAIAESTPLAAQSILEDEKVAEKEHDAVDPPLPSFDSARVPPPSLTNDVAAFLSTLTTVFSSHPELSEGLRNISRNTANGTYWNTHRESVSRAAEEIRRSVVEETSRTAGDYRRAAEEEAGKRVADALGGLMQMFGQMRTDIQDADATQRAANGTTSAQPSTANVDNTDTTNIFARRPPRTRGRPFTWADGPPIWAFGPTVAQRPPPPPGPPPPPAGPGGPPPPPPPPGPHGGHPHHPHHHPHQHPDGFGRRFPGPPPRPHPFDPFGPPQGPPHHPPWGGPFWGRHFPGPDGEHRHRHHGRWDQDLGEPSGALAAVSKWAGADSDATAHVAQWVGPSTSNANDTDPAELRAKVDIAKQRYKIEKEAYRRARGERKMAEKLDDKNFMQDGKNIDQQVPPPGVTQIVSNARGPYPELEMVSVPRAHRRTASSAAEQEAQSIRRITRRIADMGFTENAFPHIPARIKELLGAKKPNTKEGEDDVVTSLLEELLAASPQPPQASGSGTRPEKENIPGAWH